MKRVTGYTVGPKHLPYLRMAEAPKHWGHVRLRFKRDHTYVFASATDARTAWRAVYGTWGSCTVRRVVVK